MGNLTAVKGRCSRPFSAHEARIRALSDRIVAAQRPIRILDAVKWEDAIEQAFFAKGGEELPAVTRAYYQSRPLPFDPERKEAEFQEIERDVLRQLGESSAAGQIMTRRCREYQEVVKLLANRGTRAFADMSGRLYGRSSDGFHLARRSYYPVTPATPALATDAPTLAGFGQLLSGSLDHLFHAPSLGRREPTDGLGMPSYSYQPSLGQDEPTLNARETAALLTDRLRAFFKDPARVRVRLSDGILADAAAGSGCIKIRGNTRFSPRDVRLLEVHEGWVHLGTTWNGLFQPICTFLGKGPPSATVTQEGLAVLTEVLAFASYPGRLRRLANRIKAVALAEAGADFLEVFRFFQEEGHDPRESYQHAARVFRGSLPAGCGPFTKDLSYGKGFVCVYNFLRLAVSQGQLQRIPLLFCGKTSLADIELLVPMVEEGLVAPPRFLPPPFAELNALSAWLCVANVLERML